MVSTRNFSQVVVERSRRIVNEARARSQSQSDHSTSDDSPQSSILRRVFKYLPDSISDRLREALGPDPKMEKGRILLASARRQMSDIRIREAALEASRDGS